MDFNQSRLEVYVVELIYNEKNEVSHRLKYAEIVLLYHNISLIPN